MYICISTVSTYIYLCITQGHMIKAGCSKLYVGSSLGFGFSRGPYHGLLPCVKGPELWAPVILKVVHTGSIMGCKDSARGP